MRALPITPDASLVRVVGNWGESLPDETLAAQVETALAYGQGFRVVRAHPERVGLLRRRTVTVIDVIEIESLA